ncbi:hypothetical protein DAI22_01g106900 [Oryza sativa Japonica Group]|nr:hypothetical protein DAI22_01g106900 [Oryza sativa Japonica Group]
MGGHNWPVDRSIDRSAPPFWHFKLSNPTCVESKSQDLVFGVHLMSGSFQTKKEKKDPCIWN